MQDEGMKCDDHKASDMIDSSKAIIFCLPQRAACVLQGRPQHTKSRASAWRRQPRPEDSVTAVEAAESPVCIRRLSR